MSIGGLDNYRGADFDLRLELLIVAACSDGMSQSEGAGAGF